MRRVVLITVGLIGGVMVSGSPPAPSVPPAGASPAAVAVPTHGKTWSKAYLTREQKLSPTFKIAVLAKPGPNDKNRCTAFGFAAWPRLKHAYFYHVYGRRPGTQDTGWSAHIQDDAPHWEWNQYGRSVVRFPPPDNWYATTVGTVRWPKSQARAPMNWYSTGLGCNDAKAKLERWTLKGKASLSLPLYKLSRRKPIKRLVERAPRGAIMRVAEVNGKLYRVRKNGDRERLRFKDWVFPGDVLVTGRDTTASVELITGGRVGVSGDRAILVLKHGDVRDITEGEGLRKPVRKALRVWRKFSTRKEPLEIETAGGVMGIKG